MLLERVCNIMMDKNPTVSQIVSEFNIRLKGDVIFSYSTVYNFIVKNLKY